MVIIDDIYISADEIEPMTDKTFTIAKACRQETMSQREGEDKKKLVVPVQFADKTVREWIPNQTSKKTLVQRWGPDTDKWIGKTASFEIAKMNVNGEMKSVIYIKK